MPKYITSIVASINLEPDAVTETEEAIQALVESAADDTATVMIHWSDGTTEIH